MFVFLSHASKDKKLLRPLVDALIVAGIKVWIDNPAQLKLSAADIERHFFRLHANRKWEDEIDEAQDQAACTLVCWSERAGAADALTRHRVWFEEAAFGRKTGNLVSCRIDDLNPQSLPGNFAQHQMPDIRNKTDLALLIEDVLRTMDAHVRHRAERRKVGSERRSPLAPYLVNRTEQEEAIVDALDDIRSAGGVRPFFIAGPENELIDEFIKRVDEHTSRRCLGGNHCWEAVEVAWPVDEDTERFAQTYARRVASNLGRRGAVTPEDLARVLTERARPVAIVSKFRAQDWTAIEPLRLRSWLSVWHEVASIPGHRAVIPMIGIKMPPAKPGWRGIPSGGWFDGVGKKNKQICAALELIAKEAAGLRVGKPPLLCPVPETDVGIWLDQHFSLADLDRADAASRIKSLFSVADHKAHGVPHEDFELEMRPLFRGN